MFYIFSCFTIHDRERASPEVDITVIIIRFKRIVNAYRVEKCKTDASSRIFGQLSKTSEIPRPGGFFLQVFLPMLN